MAETWAPPTFPEPSTPVDLTRPSLKIPEWDPGSDALAASTLAEGTEWDHIVIAGKRLLAFVSIDGDKDTRIDVKEAPGADGANLTQVGVSPAPITIKFRFPTREALWEWADLVPTLQPRPGKPRPDAVQVYHPALAINGVKSLYLKSIGVPRVPTPGAWPEVVTRWIEFLPPTKAGQKTIGSDSVELGGKRAASFTQRGAAAKSGPSSSKKARGP